MIRCNGRFDATVSCATAFAAMAAVAMATVLAVAPAAVAEDVANGERLWKSKAGCPQCHGWAGDGFPSGFHSEGNAPSRTQVRTVRFSYI